MLRRAPSLGPSSQQKIFSNSHLAPPLLQPHVLSGRRVLAREAHHIVGGAGKEAQDGGGAADGDTSGLCKVDRPRFGGLLVFSRNKTLLYRIVPTCQFIMTEKEMRRMTKPIAHVELREQQLVSEASKSVLRQGSSDELRHT